MKSIMCSFKIGKAESGLVAAKPAVAVLLPLSRPTELEEPVRWSERLLLPVLRGSTMPHLVEVD
jgi:hypothetical protein